MSKGRAAATTRLAFFVRNVACGAAVIVLSAGAGAARALTGTTTTLAVNPGSPVNQGTAVSLVSTVTSAGNVAVKAGTVNFYDSYYGPSALRTMQLTANGTATVKLLLGPGAHSLTAVFQGTSADQSSKSSAQALTVKAVAVTGTTSTSLTATLETGGYTLDSRVDATELTPPTGSVRFTSPSNGNKVLGTVASLTDEGRALAAPVSSALPAGFITSGVAIGDLNGDGIPDLVYTGFDGGGGASNLAYVLLGKGDGTFQAYQALTVGNTPTVVKVGDFNGDGKLDLAVLNSADASVSVLLGKGDGTFGPQVVVSVPADGTPLYTLTVADANNDGKLDLVAAVYTGNATQTVALYYGKGDGTFAAPVEVGVGSLPTGVAVGDVNGDGIPDLAVCDQNDATLSILFGNGDGTFQAPVTYAIDGGATNVQLADLNHDGLLDAVVTTGEDHTDVLLGSGAGQFAAFSRILTDSESGGLVVADLNGDGILDFAVLGPPDDLDVNVAVIVFAGKGDGTFERISENPTSGENPEDLAVADLNGSGLISAAVADDGPSAEVLLGAIQYDAMLSNVLVGQQESVVATYVPGSADSYSGSVSGTVELESVATLQFSMPPPARLNTGVAPGNVTVESLEEGTVNTSDNSVATLEVVSSANSYDKSYSTHFVNGVATFTGLPALAMPGEYVYVASAADIANYTIMVNEDVKAPVSLKASTTTLAVTPASPVAEGTVVTLVATAKDAGGAIGMGTVNFFDSYYGSLPVGSAQLLANGTAAVKLRLGPGAHSLTAALVETDKDAGSVSSPQSLTVTVAGQAATMTVLTDTSAAGVYTLTADVDAYGVTATTGDVTFTSPSNGNAVLGSSGLTASAVFFGPEKTYGFGEYLLATGVATGDVNGDGILDLVVAGGETTADAGDTVAVLLGKSDGTFGAPTEYIVGSKPTDVQLGDFNGDGKLDMAVVNVNDNTLSVLLGNGDGTFKPQAVYAAGAGETVLQSLTIADIDQDGRLDLVVAGDLNSDLSMHGRVGIYYGKGDGTFEAAATLQAGTEPTGVAVGDIDGDGYPDLVVVDNYDDTVAVYLGNGDRTFQNPATYGVPDDLLRVKLGDLNGDGKLDVALTGDSPVVVDTLLNLGGGKLGAVSTVQGVGIGASPAFQIVDLNHDGKLDAVTLGFDGTRNSEVVEVALGNGDGTFQPFVQFPYSGNGAFSLVAADYAGNGLNSIAVAGGTDFGVLAGSLQYSATLGNLQVTSVETAVATFEPSNGDPYTASVSNLVTLTPPSYISFSTPPQAKIQTGQAPANVVLELFASGAIDTTDAFTATLAVTGPNGYSKTYTQTFSMGYATFSGLAALSNVGTYTYTASTASIPKSAITATQVVTVPSVEVQTTTSLAVSPVSPVVQGTVVTLVATVRDSANALVGFGTVSFYDSSSKPMPIGTAQLMANGTATFKTVLAPGTHSLTAVFAPTNADMTSTSAAKAFTVTATGLATATFLQANAQEGIYALRAEVEAFGTPAAAGSLVFTSPSNGGAALGTSALTAMGYGLAEPLLSTISASGTGNAVTTGDFNGDGKLDLAVATTNNTISILLGNGDGTFGAPEEFAVGNQPQQLQVGDFNGDGKLDLVVENNESTISVLLGNGDGTFQPQVKYADNGGLAYSPNEPSGPAYPQLVVADLNNDGILDILLADGPYSAAGDSTISVYYGNGDGTFQTPVHIGSGESASGIAVGDLNGDGKADLVTTDIASLEFSVRLSDASGTLQAPVVYGAALNYPVRVQLADLNGDGKLDIVLQSTYDGADVLLNDGHGGFSATGVNVSSGSDITSSDLVVADMNHDGILDLVMLTNNDERFGTSFVQVLAGNGDGTFQAGFSYPAGYKAVGMVAGDFNGSGLPSIAVAQGTNDVGTLLNYQAYTGGIGSVQPAAQETAIASYAPGTADAYKGSSSGTVTLVSAKSSSTTTALTVTPATPATEGTIETLVASVRDGSNAAIPSGIVLFYDTFSGGLPIGSKDLTAGGTATLKLALATGTHTLTAVFQAQATHEQSVSAADTLVVKPAPIYTTEISLTDTGTPQNYTLQATFIAEGQAAPGSNTLSFLDTSSGNAVVGSAPLVGPTPGFAPQVTIPAGNSPFEVDTADLNGDGKLDILVINQPDHLESPTGDITSQLGNGDGTFQAPVTVYTSSDYIDDIVIGDVNGDGKADLVVGGKLGSILLFLGKGDGTFQSPVQVLAPDPNGLAALFDTSGLAIGDLDRDGNLDIVAENAGESEFTVLLGNGDGTFKAPVIYPVALVGLDADEAFTLADVNQDGILDLVGSSFVRLGNGDGTFQEPVIYTTPSPENYNLITADINGDGFPDIIQTSEDQGGIVVLLNKGDGTFGNATVLVPEASAISVVAVSRNVDGKSVIDLITQDADTNVILLLRGNGDGTFQTPISFPTGSDPSLFAVGDFTGGGLPGVVVPNINDDSLSVLGGAQIFTATLDNVSFSGNGTHLVEAMYTSSATDSYKSSTSNTVSLMGGGTSTKATTVTTLSTSSATVTFRAQVTFKAVVTSTGSGTPTGPVAFYDGTTLLGSVNLAAGSASYSTSSLSTGSHTITAKYSGDTADNGSASAVLVETVTVAASSSTMLTAVPSGGVIGTNVKLTAVVSSTAGGTPTGTVTFMDGTATIGQGTLSGGSTSFTASGLGVGTHMITAMYGGDSDYPASTSTAVVVTIGKGVTTTQVSASAVKVNAGQTVTFTAMVSTTGSVAATGNVNFYDGVALLGDGTLTGASASFATSSLSAGTHAITAMYVGDLDNAASTSTALTETVVAVAPVATLSATKLSFPNTSVGASSAALSTTLLNSGNGTLTISGITLGGMNPADFAETTTCGATLAAGASCGISVVFKPASADSFAAAISIADNAAGTPQTVALSGTGTSAPAAVASLSPAAISFPNTAVGSTAAAMSATLSNTGNATLTITGINLGGANSADFAETTTCGATLAAGASCAISVTFKPISAAGFTAAISVSDNAAGSPQTVALSGTGTTASAPTVKLSPASLAFANTVVGSSSAAQSVMLSNTGTAMLNLSGISIGGMNAADFRETSNCGATLAAGASCSIAVTFTPASAASFTATIELADNASGSPQTVSLAGTGTAAPAPVASLSPASLSFPSTTVGTSSAAISTTLSNTGNAVLDISGIAIGGSNATDFAETTTCGGTLGAGAQCTISVTFTPASASAFTASIAVADNAGGSPQTALLSGTGTPPPTPVAALSPGSLTFGNTPTGTTAAAQTLTLSNTGNAALNISGISIAGSNAPDFGETTTCGTSLAAGGSCTIAVTFTPAAVGSFTGTVSVADNATGSPQTATLTGTGVVPPDFTVSSSTPVQTVEPGAAALYNLSVSSTNGSFAGVITLSATGLPPGATASFAPATLSTASGSAASVLTIQTGRQQAKMVGQHRWDWLPETALALCVPLLWWRRRNRRGMPAAVLLCLMMLGGTVLLAGCGAGFAGEPPPTSYTITVTATSGGDTHSTTVMLNVR